MLLPPVSIETTCLLSNFVCHFCPLLVRFLLFIFWRPYCSTCLYWSNYNMRALKRLVWRTVPLPLVKLDKITMEKYYKTKWWSMINALWMMDYYGSHNLQLKLWGCSKCPYCLISGSEFVFIKNDKGRCQKNVFLGLCPKHRTPTTHCARLGLHKVKNKS